MNEKVNVRKIKHLGNTWLGLEFPFDTQIVNEIKKIEGARWTLTHKLWLVPFKGESVDTLKHIFTKIIFLDEASALLSGDPEYGQMDQQKRKFDIQDSASNFENEKVKACKHEGYIYLKANVHNLKDRSFLAGLEFSRNFLDSGYWKIKESDEVKRELRKYFANRLQNSDTLLKEITDYEVKLRTRNKIIATIKGKQIKLMFEKDRQIIAFIKKIPFHRWDTVKRQWSVPLSAKNLDILKGYCSDNKLELEIDQVQVINKVAERTIRSNDPAYRKCPVEMVEKLKNKRYSESTIRQYTSMFEEFINYHKNIPLEELGSKEIDEFISYLVQKRRVSISYQNVSVNAIKFYFEKVLGNPRNYYDIDRPRAEKNLPEILTRKEIVMLISAVKNIKHRFILILLYSTGLRRAELLNLKVEDIDRENMQIWIRGGKGKKDRYVQLSKNALKVFDEYIKLYNPEKYLIEGRKEQYSASSVIAIIKAAAKKAGINKRITPHKFRHSYATHLLEDGVDIRFIQELLGHGSIKTTQIYSHVTDRNIKNITNPFDKLEL